MKIAVSSNYGKKWHILTNGRPLCDIPVNQLHKEKDWDGKERICGNCAYAGYKWGILNIVENK